MGLFSSAQLVRFLSMDVRPNVARAVSRNMSPELSREFIGRLMADPAFAQKMVIEQMITAAGSIFYEWRHRGDNFVNELDFVVANTLTLCMANAALVWTIAPNRSYGSANKLPWQSMLSGLPNNVFDASGPLRTYTNATRTAGFFAKVKSLPTQFLCLLVPSSQVWASPLHVSWWRACLFLLFRTTSERVQDCLLCPVLFCFIVWGCSSMPSLGTWAICTCCLALPCLATGHGVAVRRSDLVCLPCSFPTMFSRLRSSVPSGQLPVLPRLALGMGLWHSVRQPGTNDSSPASPCQTLHAVPWALGRSWASAQTSATSSLEAQTATSLTIASSCGATLPSARLCVQPASM